MCTVTNKLKFCTCKSTSTDRLKHYWILHRFNKYKDFMILGLPVFQDALPFNYEENKMTISKRINEPDAFDFQPNFKEKDQIEICLNNTSDKENERSVFCFYFKKGKWVPTESDSFDLMNKYDELQFGKLKGIKE